jgi:alpha-glucosidase (family GH31 glycosyl hydrolase)
MKKGGIIVLIYVLSLLINQSYAAIIASQISIPSPGTGDVAQLNSPTSDTLNILGTGITSSGTNDSATYVANDRSTQGQTFRTGSNAVTLAGIWVQHVGYTTYLNNGTYAGVSDGSEVTVRISSVSGTALNVLRSETATVESGNGFSGGGNNGTGRWLYIGLDTPVSLSANTLYAFDLTSYSPWFELAGLEAGPYSGGAAYTTAAKLNTIMDTVYPAGDRSFMADMTPSAYNGGDAAGYEISLEAITDRIIHIHCVATGQTAKQSLIVPADIVHDPVSVTIEDNATTYTLRTSQVTAQLNKTTKKVSFYTSGGQLILAENGRSIASYSHQESTGGITWTLNQIAQSWAASESEAYYGLGQFDDRTMNWQGKTVGLEQYNTNAVSPFVVSSSGYGLLWDVNCSAEFSAANSAGVISFSADATFGLDYYFIYGPGIDGVINEYRVLTGPAPMYPRWGFGYWQCKERYSTQTEVQTIAATFRNDHFPIDLIIQDWRYWGKEDENAPDSVNKMWSGMVWDAVKYPDPNEMIRYLHEDLNMKFMAVIWPFIGPNSQLAADLDANGGLLQGCNWASGNLARLFNTYDKIPQDIYWDYANRGLFQRGLDAWWMDASEPEDLGNLSGDTGYGPLRSCHNAYSLLHTENIYKHQRQTSDAKRVVSLTRSGYAGQQRTGGATWSGDIVTSWDTLKNQIAGGINFGMSGLPYWTTDIGGFFTGSFGGNKTPAFQEIYQRWFQYGAFCPLFRSHGTNTAREPWQFDGNKGPIFKSLKKYADLRYRLMPYIYTLGSEGYT